jgi:hypothetical protein
MASIACGAFTGNDLNESIEGNLIFGAATVGKASTLALQVTLYPIAGCHYAGLAWPSALVTAEQFAPAALAVIGSMAAHGSPLADIRAKHNAEFFYSLMQALGVIVAS